MKNTTLPTLVNNINETLSDGNQAVLHQESIRFIVKQSENKMSKLLEYMDLIETISGKSANEYQFEVAYVNEN